jgi:transcriptional regulator with XRE-family HTH domain
MKAKELAVICGISASYLSELESGKRANPAKLLIEKFAAELDVTVDWLLGRADNCTISKSVLSALLPESPPDSKGHRSGLLPAVQPVSAFRDGSADPDVPFDLPGAGERVVIKGVRYGSAPPYHTVPYAPGWNLNLGAMSDEDILTELRECLERIPKRKRGPDRAHLCHYLMDFLNELANRREKTAGSRPQTGDTNEGEEEGEEERRKMEKGKDAGVEGESGT